MMLISTSAKLSSGMSFDLDVNTCGQCSKRVGLTENACITNLTRVTRETVACVWFVPIRKAKKDTGQRMRASDTLRAA